MTTHKQRKKKQREREVKEKMLRRRKAIDADRKYQRQLQEAERRVAPKMTPYRKDKDPQEIQKQIERNLEVLKALEEQFKQEEEARRKVNSELEAEGHLTPEQKFEAIKRKAEALTKKNLAQTADVLADVPTEEIAKDVALVM